MKFIRSLPLMWASTRWPFSSSTANIVLGNGSMTVPSTSIASFLATGVDASLSHGECRSAGTDTRTRSVPEGPLQRQTRVSFRGPRSSSSYRGKDLWAVLGDRDRVLEMGGQGAVPCHDRPAVRLDRDLAPALGQHRLDGEADAR